MFVSEYTGTERTREHLNGDRKLPSNTDEPERTNEISELHDREGETAEETNLSVSQTNLEADRDSSRKGDFPKQNDGEKRLDLEMPSSSTGEPNLSKSLERQGLNETDLTLVSSIDVSSQEDSLSEHESLWASEALSDDALTHRTLENVEQSHHEW